MAHSSRSREHDATALSRMSAVSRLDRTFGIVRSVVTYYGIPLRARRLRRFYSQFVTSGSLCFDVGAHAGNRVRCWLQLNARVVAIEPQPDFVRLLRFSTDATRTSRSSRPRSAARGAAALCS